MTAAFVVPEPRNEPPRDYAPGSPERDRLQRRLDELAAEQIELTMTVDGVERMAGGDEIQVVQPHRHRHVLGVARQATNNDVADAVAAAKRAAPEWRGLPQQERDAVFLRAAELLAGPWRDTVNGATMLGQSKTAFQAEIDSACELIDFWRYNVHFAHKLLGEQPLSSPGVWNRFDHRPLEGFVLAITPFNFTAIAGNLPTSPALLGNVVVWKPSPTQQLAAHYTMRVLEEAGLKDRLAASVGEISYGDVTDFSHFGGAVIDKRAYDRLTAVQAAVASDPDCTVLAGGKSSDAEGWFVEPTLVEVANPDHETFWREYFGPILAVYVYDDDKFGEVVAQAADIAPYGLTGSLFATDRRMIDRASETLRFSAGNFYVNDKPIGAVVGHQPCGGARGSGTNDKAGSWQNLVRWISPRTIKETFVPPTDWRYPHMG